jgi:ribosomal protein S1
MVMMDDSRVDSAAPVDTASSINDLRPKMRLDGCVTKIDLYGAFVDIGIGQDALIHISRLKRGRVNRVSEVLSEGDQISVYVDKVEKETGRVSLTMIKPLDVTWGDLKRGNTYTGKITRLEPYGAFVDIGAERPGLVHVSELGEEFVRHPDQLHSVGDDIAVRVLNFDRKKRRIDLTIADSDLDEESSEGEEEAEDAASTAMEIALRRALEGSDMPHAEGRRPRSRRTGARGRGKRSQDDLLARTLRSRKS